MPIKGHRELSAQLSKLGKAAGGKALRSGAMSAMLPALRAAQAAAPVRAGDSGLKRTYKGRLVAPGFASRNVKRRSFMSYDKRTVWVSLGMAKEAFYAVSFIELGTSTYARKPWLEPAFRRSLPEVYRALGVNLKRTIDKAARR